MKFFRAAMSLCLATSTAMATPVAVEVRQQGTTAIGSIDATVQALLPLLPQYEAAIESAVAAVRNASVTASAAVILAAEATINTNLASIVSALNSSANAIIAATANTAGGVAAIAAQLTQAEINQLEQDIYIVRNIISGLGVVVTGTATLGASFSAAIETELAALENALEPFINPLVVLVNAAANAAASASVTVTGVQNAVSELRTIVGNLINSIGA